MSLNQKDCPVMPAKQLGFTLLELMVTLSVAGILTAIAIPSFTETIKNNRMTAQVNEFVTALNFTRGEAIKRGVRVSMCKSSDAMTCMRDGAGSNWAQGWIIFTNQDNDGVYDGGDEIILKVQDAAQAQITVVGNPNVDDIISFLPSGQINLAGSIFVCDDRVGEVGRRIAIAATTGRARIQTTPCA